MAHVNVVKPNTVRTAPKKASGNPKPRSKSLSKEKPKIQQDAKRRTVSLSEDNNKYDKRWWEDILKQNSSPMKAGNSDRGGWWRKTLKDTPAPGAYTLKDFIQESLENPVSQTYRFKGESRMGKTLPDQQFFVNNQMSSQPKDYSIEKVKSRVSLEPIKSSNIRNNAQLAWRKYENDISPASYNLMISTFGSVQPFNGVFRSSVKRFPTIYFTPKEGPAPGQYDVKTQSVSQAITSSFQSKVPRFFITYSQTPGPSSYNHDFQLPRESRLSNI